MVKRLSGVRGEQVGYLIKCGHSDCGKETWAAHIVELVQEHTNVNGEIKCSSCGKSGAWIFQKSKMQESQVLGKDDFWERYVKGVVTIKTDYDYYVPYVFLTSQTKGEGIDGYHFSYYKDLRNKGGSLKHGHGPGGGPVYTRGQILQLLNKLLDFGALDIEDLRKLANTRK